MSTNSTSQLDKNGIDYVLENVMTNVLQDIDEFLPIHNKINNNHMNMNIKDTLTYSIYDEMSANMLPVAYNNNMHHMNMNTNINNIQYESKHDSDITPNTSYNSLVSLNSSTTEPDNINIPLPTNNNSHLNGSSTKIQLFESINNIKIQLKDYVFISKDCTRRLGQYIVRENWGKECGLLYKYLDYIFRCQAFAKQTIEVNDKYLIFHSGLQRRSDNEFLYVLLIPNKKHVTQKWRVQFGAIKNSFLSKNELLNKFTEPYIVNDYLPQRTRFNSSLSQLLYDETYPIEVNWEERLTTNKDRLLKVLGNLIYEHKFEELIYAFNDSLKQTQKIAELNPRLAVAQGFVDTKNCKYRMELLLPLCVEFPKYSKKFYTFALAINKSNTRKYIVKSILTMEMAYANARLVGYVDSSWLYYGNQNNGKMDINDFFLQNSVQMYTK